MQGNERERDRSNEEDINYCWGAVVVLVSNLITRK